MTLTLVRVQSWAVPMLWCIEHNSNDGLRASSDGLLHGVIVNVPVSLMEKAGTCRFVLHFYDDYVDSYKNHKIKAALEVNAENLDLPIIYIRDSNKEANWHVAWCRPKKGVQIQVHVLRKSYAAIEWAKQVQKGEVRAAVNGGFFNRESKKAVGEVGNGSWLLEEYCTKQRWAFGFTSDGTKFDTIRMEEIEIKIDKKLKTVYIVPKRFKQRFPYGLGNVGLLAQDGKPKEPKDSKDWPDPSGSSPRTAIAWTKEGHVFLVTFKSATWADVRDFILYWLPYVLEVEYKIKIKLSSISAVMLDGGGSTQFAYRRKNKKGIVVQEERNAPESDGRWIHNIIGAKATWE